MSMTGEESVKVRGFSFLMAKVRDYLQMMKPNLTTMVVFTSVIGYLLVPGIHFDLIAVVVLFIGGMLSTNGALIINQIIERTSDKYMHRTSSRPLPAGRMSVTEAGIIIAISSIIGIALLGFYFNWLAAGLSLLSLVLYGFIYTPMKKIHPIATFIGAIPGALPPLIGWVAGTGSLSPTLIAGGLVLFGIQLFWQFPHVWAIAWLAYDDYLKAGIRLLPTKKTNPGSRFTALQCILNSLPLIPLVILPSVMGFTGRVSMWLSVVCTLGFIGVSVIFYVKNNTSSAKRLFYASLIYLPLVLLFFILDKV